MEPLHIVLPEEIALEGLDGSTLDTLWFRLSERLKISLPFHEYFKNEVWKIILSRSCFEYYEIEADRGTPKKMDRKDLVFNTETPREIMTEHMKSFYYIYSHHPVDHPEIRGSCKEFDTRRKISLEEVKKMCLPEIYEKYNQKFVIVASQHMRNLVLIPTNIGRDVELNNHAYCILERIGRSRYFGETTSGEFSLNDYIKDSKLLHYFRKLLLKNQLVIRQQLQVKVNGKRLGCQLFHLPRFYVVIQASNMIVTEKIFQFLLTKPTFSAEMSEVRNLVNMKPKLFASLLKSQKNIFNYEVKAPYRSCYPDATKEQCMHKNKSERLISVIRLVDPTMDIFQLWNIEDEDAQGEEKAFLDISNQKINRTLIHQVCQKITESGREGMSQLEIGTYFGLPKLNARSVIRKLQRNHNITFYMKDVGRQRFSKYVTKDAAQDASAEFVAEMTKLLLKADENATKAPIPILKTESYPSSSMKFLKPEPTAQPVITQYFMPATGSATELDESQVQDQQIALPEVKTVTTSDSGDQGRMSVFVPVEDFSFIDNVEDVSVSMRFLNNISKVKKQSIGIAQSIAQSKISKKVLNRMNAILDVLKSKTILDANELLQSIRQKESNLQEVLCRKSLHALCSKLADDNYMKIIEMQLKTEKKTVNLLFFGEPNVSFDMRCWHSIIEEQKLQHFINCHQQPTENVQPISPSMQSATVDSKTSVANEDFGAQSKVYDNFPKFMKMKLFHEFLFYLIYAFPKNYRKIPIEKAVEVWQTENPKVFDSEPMTENITNCYSTEISWKMFVSPLNPQRDYENGWGFLRDIIHRIPLILFVKFTRFGQGNAELQKYLSHPIKSNYLLHFLPKPLRDLLLNGRKYVFVIQDLCKKLCCCGLLQFGASRTKEVDQSFVFLNRNSSLLDTTHSEDGYLEVSDQEYPEIHFHFNSPEAVSEYWNKMHQIAMNTKINKKSAAFKTVEIEPLYTKPDIQDAFKIQTPASAPLNDNGLIPGDHKGAAGLDKAFLSHLKRSWTRPLEGEKIIRRRIVSSKSQGMIRKVASRKSKASKEKKKASAKIIGKSISVAQAKFVRKSRKTISKPKGVAKISAINKIKQRAMLAQDVIDKEALKMMKTMRVTWSEGEDKTLLLIKVALKFAFAQEAQSAHYVSACLVRDILHWKTEKALNKTSKACSRRIQYLVKTKPSFKEQVALYNEELKTNQEFMMKYQNLAERLKKVYPPEEVHNAVKIHLVEMVHRMHQVFYKQYLTNKINIREDPSIQLPKKYDQLAEKYTIINPANTLIEKKYSKPKTTKEVEIFMLMSLIHSAICCSHDKTSYSYQLFEIYKKFSDANLSTAVSRLKRASVISVNKKDRSRDESILPYSFSPFHLSPRYSNQLGCVHVPVELYDEYTQALEALSASNGSYQMSNLNCGWIFMLSEMISLGKIQLSYEKTDKLVTLDQRKKTNFERVSENYLRLKNKQSEDGSKEKKKVKFHVDKSHDETFVFAQDATEAFLKMDPIYLHSFCVVKALGSSETVLSKSWKVLEDGECSVKHCIVMDDNKFAAVIRLIAAENILLVKEIKKNSKAQKSNNVVTVENFISFFNTSIHQSSTMKENNRKDFSGRKMKASKRITAEVLVDMILELAVEPVIEDYSWISEYKKISRKTEDDVLDEEDLDATTDPAKNQRITSQLKELNVQGRNSDMFVVNLSTIFVKTKEISKSKITFDGAEYNETMISFTQEERNEFAQKIVSESVFKQEDLQVKELLDELATVGIKNTLEIMQISETCEFIQLKGQMGASSSDLVAMFKDKKRLQQHVETLMKLKFIVKVGVIESKFIHKEFIPFWLIDSFYVVRDVNSQVDVDDENLKRPSNKCDEEEPAEKRLKIDEPVPSTSAAADAEDARAVEKKEEPKKTPLIRIPVRVRPTPWIRVNGTLNRRVLDKWLGTILNHLTLVPNMMINDLCNKFSILTPFDVRTLCEFLETIGSVKLMTINESEIDFFSAYSETTVEPATFFCPSSNVFVELNQDAMQRLAFFIGRRKYKTSFV